MADCAPTEGAPTLAGELRRGVNPYNLKFGLVAAVLLSAAVAALTWQGWFPDLAGGALRQGGYCLVGLFVVVTAIHTVAHGLMGWVFQVGLRYHCRGDFRRAARWLALAERPGMDHYDPHGVALEALRDCRGRLV